MMWFKFNEKNLPAQGLKVLCMQRGDFWVCQRFNYKGRSYWLPIPFVDSSLANCEPPDYWTHIPFHTLYGKKDNEGKIIGQLGGMIKVKIENDENLYTIDDFEKLAPQEHEQFVKGLLGMMKNSLPCQPLD